MKRLIKKMVVILVVLLASAAVQADFGLVENFDSMATGSPDGRACTGVMGGTWDTESESTGSINVVDNSGSRCVTVIGHSSGANPHGMGFNGITNTIDDSETGKVFFRLMLRSYGLVPRTYVGLISDANDNPITRTSADAAMSIPAGFGLLDNGSGGINLVKTDGKTVLKADVIRGQWHNFWIVANNAADTFDLYLSAAEGPAGKATLPKPEDLVEKSIPFGVATTDPLTGMIFTCPTGTGQAERIYIDEIYWDGDQGLGTPTKARNPSPVNQEPNVPRDVILSWTPGVYADKHDVYFGTNFNDVNDADRVNPLGVLPSQNQDANTYDPPGLLEFGQTYYWRVDEVNAPPDNTIFKGGVWSFTIEPVGYPIACTVVLDVSGLKIPGGTYGVIDGAAISGTNLRFAPETDIAKWSFKFDQANGNLMLTFTP